MGSIFHIPIALDDYYKSDTSLDNHRLQHCEIGAVTSCDLDHGHVISWITCNNLVHFVAYFSLIYLGKLVHSKVK